MELYPLLFSSCRIPGPKHDYVSHHRRSPTHITVVRNYQVRSRLYLQEEPRVRVQVSGPGRPVEGAARPHRALDASDEASPPVRTFQLTVSVAAVLPVGGLQQRRLSAHRVPDPQSAAQDPLSVLEDGQGADGHPDQRAPPHLGAGLQPSADRWVPVQSPC